MVGSQTEEGNLPPGSAEFAAALIRGRGLHCGHFPKYGIDANLDISQFPSRLGFFHNTGSEMRISYLETNKLCIPCLHKVAPDGFNYWSMLAEARDNTNPPHDALGISQLEAFASRQNYPPLFQAGTESSPVTIPMPDVPHAKAVWQWLQEELKPFYMDQLHLTKKKLTPLARRTAETDAAIARKHGVSLSHRRAPKTVVQAALCQPTEPFGGGSTKTPGHRSQSSPSVESIDDTTIVNSTSLAREVENSSSAHDPRASPPCPANTESRSSSASIGHSSKAAGPISRSSKAAKSSNVAQEPTEAAANLKKKKKAKISSSRTPVLAAGLTSSPLEQSTVAGNHDKKKSKDTLSAADNSTFSLTKVAPSPPTVASTAEQKQKSAPNGLQIFGQGQEEAVKETPSSGSPALAALANNNSPHPKIENVSPYNSLMLSTQLLAKKPSSKAPKAPEGPSRTRHWSQHSPAHFLTPAAEPDPDTSALGNRKLLPSPESKTDRAKKRDKSTKEHGTGPDKTTAKGDTGAKEKAVKKTRDEGKESAKEKESAKGKVAAKDKSEKEKTTGHQPGKAPSSATRETVLPAKPERSTRPAKEHKLFSKADSRSKDHNRPLKEHSTKHLRSSGPAQARGFDLRRKPEPNHSISNHQHEKGQSHPRKDNDYKFGKKGNNNKHHGDHSGQDTQGHNEGGAENKIDNQNGVGSHPVETPAPSAEGTHNYPAIPPVVPPITLDPNASEVPPAPEDSNAEHSINPSHNYLVIPPVLPPITLDPNSSEVPQAPENNNSEQSINPSSPASISPSTEAEPLTNEPPELGSQITELQSALVTTKPSHESLRSSLSGSSDSSLSSNRSTQPPGQGDINISVNENISLMLTSRVSLRSLSSRSNGSGSRSRSSSSSGTGEEANSGEANYKSDASSDEDENNGDSDHEITNEEDNKSDQGSDAETTSDGSQPGVDETSGSDSHEDDNADGNSDCSDGSNDNSDEECDMEPCSDNSDEENDPDMGSDGYSSQCDLSGSHDGEDDGDNSDIDLSNGEQDSEYHSE